MVYRFFSSLKYRQHEANELGGNIGLKKKLKRFKFISDGNMSKQLKYFFKLNISKSENYQFLFSTNFFKTFIFLIKNLFILEEKIPKIILFNNFNYNFV